MAIKTVVTPKGTTLPLVNLKGKDYLMVAHRIQWFVEENKIYHLNTNFLVLDDIQTVAQVTVLVLNEQGQVLQKAMATKRETKADFSDHLEKAETGALGRALIQLGYGTQYALADLDEGHRLADAPLVDVRPTVTTKPVAASKPAPTTPQQSTTTVTVPTMEYSHPVNDDTTQTVKKPSFRKTKKTEETVAQTETPVATTPPSNGNNGGWL